MTMKIECYQSGSCVECGCDTPDLQMADKSCRGKCYPEMMTKKEWKKYKLKNNILYVSRD